MTLRILVGRTDSAPEEVSVTFGPEDRVGDLARAVARLVDEPGQTGLALAGGPQLDPEAPLAQAPIRSGDHLVLIAPGQQPERTPGADLELRVVGGAAAGLRFPLPEGGFSLGRSTACDLRLPDPSVSRAPAWLRCQAGGVTVESLEPRQEILVEGRPITPPATLPLGQVFEMGPALLVVTGMPRARRPGGGGSIPFLGRPQRDAANPLPRLVLPRPPAKPAPVPLAIAQAWRERRRAEAYRAEVVGALENLPRLLAQDAVARREAAPDPCDLADRARLCLPNLWERRPADEDFLRLRLGTGEAPSRVGLEWPEGRDPDLVAEVKARLRPPDVLLRRVPVTVDLARHRFLAVSGEPADVDGLARWLIVQAACLHRPSELLIGAVLGDDETWSWLHWLPHCRPGGRPGEILALGESAAAQSRLSALIEEREQAGRMGRPASGDRRLLLVLDAGSPGADVLLEQILEAPDVGISAIVLGSRPSARVPVVAELGIGRGELHLSISDEGGAIAIPDRVDLAFAAGVARDLAGIDEVTSASPPKGAARPSLIEVLSGGSERELAGAVATAWSTPASGLGGVIGVGENGPVRVDLATGRHALVSGSLEAGRGEVMAAWMASLAFSHSPRDLNLVLLGSGSGAAFDALRRLPHAVRLREVPIDLAIESVLEALLAEADRRARNPGGPALVVVVDGGDRLLTRRPDVEGRLVSLASVAGGTGIHIIVGAQALGAGLPAGLRGQLGLRVEIGPGTWSRAESPWTAQSAHWSERTARVSLDGSPPEEVWLPRLEGAGEAGPLHVERLAGDLVEGPGELARTIAAIGQAARARGEPAEGWTWRGEQAIFALPDMETPAALEAAPARRLHLRLSVEIPMQTPRDVLIEAAGERTVAELQAALASRLGLDPPVGMGLQHPRRRIWLRPEQSIGDARLRTGDRLVLASRSGRIDGSAQPPGLAALEGRLDQSGRVPFNRPPRARPRPPDLQLRLDAPPERGQASWRSLVPVATGVAMGLMMGGVMYLASGPNRQPGMVMLSAGMTPLMAVVTGIMPAHDLWKRRRTFRQEAAEFREKVREFGRTIVLTQAEEAAQLQDAAPGPEILRDRARSLDPALWERRPGDADWLDLRVGLHDAPSALSPALGQGGDQDLRQEAEREISARRLLTEVPLVLPLGRLGAVGVHGDPAAMGALVRWMAIQLAVLHSPEEVVIAAGVPARDARQWRWMTWLPHLQSEAVDLPGPRLVAGATAARGLLQRLQGLVEERRDDADAGVSAAREGSRTTVVVILHEELDLPRAQVSWLLQHGPAHGVHCVWLAARRHELPGECRAEVALGVEGSSIRAEVRLVETGERRVGSGADGLSAEVADEVARALAGVRDLGARGARSVLPAHVDLLPLLAGGGDLASGVTRRWDRAVELEETPVPLGSDSAGVWTFELALDGPHVLVEGPANSGKSELLRSLVIALAASRSPRSMAFLFLDPEGQGTFADFAGLPHTAGLVSHLDAGSAERVLSALRSELRAREESIREAGARDLASLARLRPEGAPPSLVVVVDEVSRLASDLPELVPALFNLLQQGNRLGVHLLLATRRPALAPKEMREGGALRVTMRQRPDAGSATRTGGVELPPGRAFVQAGPGQAREVQVAFAGGHSEEAARALPVVIRELDLAGLPVPVAAPAVDADRGDPDGRRIVRAVQAAAGGLGMSTRADVLVELAEDADKVKAVATSVPLSELLGIEDMGVLDVEMLWRPRPLADRLRVPTGLDGLGNPLVMDLKEAAAGGSGPHGLLIGTSGSGKSEMLRTLVTALALTHPPEVLAFVFIDFKGGAAFAGLSELPHRAGVITNLQDDLSLIDRMQAAISGERNRRQELLRRAGNVDKLSEYQRKREAGEDLEPLPYLLLVVDEFGELLTARPDFVDLFAMVGRVGRSLGMHLLFSSQQFEEGRLRGLEDNLGYRVALRTASPQASRTVLGVPDAFELPKEPGWGYYKFGPSDMARFRAALVSQPYVGVAAAGLESTGAGGDPPTVIDVAVAQLRQAASPVHQIWLPPLQVGVTLDDKRVLGRPTLNSARGLAARSWAGSGQLRVPIGLVDKPADQKQDVMAVDLTGHLLVVGAAQTGKSTLLRTLLASAALTHTPAETQFYCIDYGGGALRAVAGLPHVGEVCGRGDPERVRRTIEEVADLVGRRERAFQALRMDSPQVMRARRAAGDLPEPMADVFLVVDNWLGLREDFGELEPTIQEIAARGPGYGVHLILTANRWLEVRDALRNSIGGRLELRLNDPLESAIDTRAARSLSEAGKQFERRMEELRQLNGLEPKFDKLYGRGIVGGGLQFQTALPRIDGRDEILDLQSGFESLVEAVSGAWKGGVAPPIRVLPLSVGVGEVASLDGAPAGGVPIGISEVDLGPVGLDLVEREPHFVVIGDVESGKTTLLRTFLSGLVQRFPPEQAQVMLVDYRRSLAGVVSEAYLLAHCTTEARARESVATLAGSLERRLPQDGAPAAQLRDRSGWKSQAEVYVVVDDYDLVMSPAGNPLQPLYALLPQARDAAFHLVVARSSGGAGQAIMEPVLRRLRDLGTPMLLMSGEPQEGTIAGGYRLIPLPPGRGRLVRRREPAVFVQVAR